MSPRARHLFAVAMVIVFLAATPPIVLQALGYRLDWSERRLRLTGGILLATSPRGGTVTVDGRVWPERTPTVLRRLLPGDREVRITRLGYAPWARRIIVEAGSTTLFEDIRLVRTDQTWRTKRTLEGRDLVVSPNGRQAAWLADDDAVHIGDLADASRDLTVAGPVQKILAWSPSGRYVIVQLTDALGIVDRANPAALTPGSASAPFSGTYPFAATVQRVRWNSAAEGYVYLLDASEHWHQLDLVTGTLQPLPFPALDLLAHGDDLATIEYADLTGAGRLLVRRRTPEYAATSRDPLPTGTNRFADDEWFPLATTDGHGLTLGSATDPLHRFQEPLQGLMRLTPQRFLVRTQSEVWYLNPDGTQTELIGRFPQVVQVAPAGGWPMAFILLPTALLSTDANHRGGQYRTDITLPPGTPVSLTIDGENARLISGTDGRLSVFERQVF